MAEKTRIRFFGVLPGPYDGAARMGCKPDDPRVLDWYVTVGGTNCNLKNLDDFVAHFEDFLRYAYKAGVDDTKAELREKLGLETD